MLSTKNITETSRFSKTLNPGKHTVKLNSISLSQGYEADSYNVHLHVEGPDLGSEFEGFFVNPEDKNGPRYKGQIGRIRLSPFAYKDGVTKTGRKVSRDQNILQGLKALSKALGKEAQLDAIEAETIEEFVDQASQVLSGPDYFNIVAGGKQYERNGYKQYDLFVPNSKDGKYGFEPLDVKESRLMTFDPAIHITGVSNAKPVDSFEPAPADNDFDL